MKTLQDRPIWQSALILIGIASVLFVTGSMLLMLVIFPEHGDKSEKVLSSDRQHGAILLSEALCTSFGSTDVESIQWVSPAGHRRTIFRYETPGGIASDKGVAIKYPITPSVTWRDASNLHIAITAVGSIVEKNDSVDGVQVSYDIGLVIFR